MGRRKKFKNGDVVWFEREAPGHRQYAVVVDYYRREGAGEAGEYIVLPTTSPYTQMRVYGGPVQVRSNRLHSAGADYRMKTLVSRYRNNKALGPQQRGCYCHCCIHIAIPPSEVTSDGEFKEDA